MPQSGALWEAIETFDIETKNEYWLKINPNFYHLSTSEKVYGIEKLIHYHRYIVAMHSCRYALEDIYTEIIVNLLEKIATEKTEESY